MMIIVKGVTAATVKLKCPHCGKLQLRARKTDKHAGYRCRECHKLFKPTQRTPGWRG